MQVEAGGAVGSFEAAVEAFVAEGLVTAAEAGELVDDAGDFGGHDVGGGLVGGGRSRVL